jgi:hypothetical protein
MSLEDPIPHSRCPNCGKDYDEDELAEIDPAEQFVCTGSEYCRWRGTKEQLIGEWDDAAWDW